jgi:hypothetical protein
MAVNPLQWNPIRANFGDATGMMQSAGQSIGRATDTVGNIFKQAQEAERQRLEQEDMLKRRAMEEERLGIAKAGEEREAETYRIESEGSVLGNNFYEDFSKKRKNKPELTYQEYIAGINVEGVDPRSLDIGLDKFIKRVKEEQDIATKALDRATKENEYNTLQEVKNYNLDYSKSLDELKTDLKTAKLSQGAQNKILETFGNYKVMENTLDKLAESKESKVTKEEKENTLIAYNSLKGKPQERINLLTGFMMKHNGDPEAVRMAQAGIENELRLMNVEADKARAYVKSINMKNKDLKTSLSKFNTGKSIYVAERLKNYGLEKSDIINLTEQLNQIGLDGNGVNLDPLQLYSIYDISGKTSGSHTLGIFGGDTIFGEDAKTEIQGFDKDLITTINGVNVVDIRSPIGNKILEQLKINADNLGIPHSNVPIIKNTYEMFGSKKEVEDTSIKPNKVTKEVPLNYKEIASKL